MWCVRNMWPIISAVSKSDPVLSLKQEDHTLCAQFKKRWRCQEKEISPVTMPRKTGAHRNSFKARSAQKM